jgi:hypothetical protein
MPVFLKVASVLKLNSYLFKKIQKAANAAIKQPMTALAAFGKSAELKMLPVSLEQF